MDDHPASRVQLFGLLQPKLPAQGLGVPGTQPPTPLQILSVSMSFEQLAPQLKPSGWYTQAPPSLHPVGSEQTLPPIAHMLAQQYPVPAVPQISDSHWLLALHGQPGDPEQPPPPLVAPPDPLPVVVPEEPPVLAAPVPLLPPVVVLPTPLHAAARRNAIPTTAAIELRILVYADLVLTRRR